MCPFHNPVACNPIVPEGHATLARRFNAGIDRLIDQVPKARLSATVKAHNVAGWKSPSGPRQRICSCKKLRRRNPTVESANIKLIHVYWQAMTGTYTVSVLGT